MGPLAHRVRPLNSQDFVGFDKLLKRYPSLLSQQFSSLIFYGPSGIGKTTLATILAKERGLELFHFCAVLGGLAELRKLISRAEEMAARYNQSPAIFIDEIHRFNKAQQDALLPHVEKGAFTLFGATTENPRVSVNKALLSRVQLIKLGPLTKEDIKIILRKCTERENLKLDESILDLILAYSSGDARKSLNLLETIQDIDQSKRGLIEEMIAQNSREYDLSSDRHYDVISAFIKSLRGSSPDAALLYLAIMLDGGEDPNFISRRLIIFASEDIGNADPAALNMALAAHQAVKAVGLPEGRIPLAQAVTYLACSPKSNASYLAINEALKFVEASATTLVPDHLKNHPPSHAPAYLYPHNYHGHYIKQAYTKDKIPSFYRPTEQGEEKKLKQYLSSLPRA